MLPIPIFIGISERFRFLEGLTAFSIRENTNHPVDITHLYPSVESGCTGFSDVRFTIEYGIYLDVDMIVLGDIAELWAYRKKDKFVCLKDGSTEVAVIDCKHRCRNKRELDKLPMARDIPLVWNVEDRVTRDAKLVHYTDLNTQPWFYTHPDKEATQLYENYKQRATMDF